MRPKINYLAKVIPMLAVLAASGGCDERVVEIAREASDRQAAQNAQMAELQQEVASGTHELVKSDAAARKAMIGVHRDLQQERCQLEIGWTNLELERRRVDQERRTSANWQITIAALVSAGFAITLFGFLWQLLARARCIDSVDEELSELVLEHFLTPDATREFALHELPVHQQLGVASEPPDESSEK